MNQAVQRMLERYNCQHMGDYENAVREVFQELALLGLWRGKFFEHAAFYGGTALRILYGLDRFSEDMDFSLLAPNPNFDFSPYCSWIEKELEAWGFSVTVQVKQKTSQTSIESAFLKANTVEQLLLIEAKESVLGGIHADQKLKIKVEVDINPPLNYQTESKYLLEPIPFAVRTYTMPCLFAGKMHALLYRNWGQRVKGRDWFDFVWYISRGTSLNLQHLEARMRQTGHWTDRAPLTEDHFRSILSAKIEELDVSVAKKDVEPFVKHPDQISVWSRDFFEQISARINVT